MSKGTYLLMELSIQNNCSRDLYESLFGLVKNTKKSTASEATY